MELIEGSKNIVADLLSRYPLMVLPSYDVPLTPVRCQTTLLHSFVDQLCAMEDVSRHG